MRVLVLGVTGMLGHALFRLLSRNSNFQVFGTCRVRAPRLPPSRSILENVSVMKPESWQAVISDVRPSVVINCIGVVKQLDDAKNPVISIATNSLFPHELASVCADLGGRLIHFSTDCVFSGNRGHYKEDDIPDPIDLYGRSKLLGEVNLPTALTFRTSIIGHGLEPNRSLIDWFLSQRSTVSGYMRAIYSGLPTIEVGRIIEKIVIPRPDLNGILHLSSDPISKFELLNIVARVYGTRVSIVPNSDVFIDRSLDSTKFRDLTGYVPPDWEALINVMHGDFADSGRQRN